MKYDFTTIMDRRGKDAIAVEALGTGGGAPDLPQEGFDTIPMWVADMNFGTAPAVTEAISGRLQHPAFGYFAPREEYLDAIIGWQERRNGAKGLTRDCIGYENGVLGGVASALAAFAAPGESILLHSPVYVGFTHTLNNNGYHAVHSSMKKDADGIWRMDYEDMDAKLKKYQIHAAIFCNPHNPCGRVWEKWEIEKAMEVYAANDCVVISDEIWSDIILEGNHHTPTQMVSEDARNRTIAMYAATKTFNLAGLVGSYHIIYNPYLRDRVRAQGSKSHYNSMNVLSMYGLIGAYSPEGEEWVEELLQVLTENVRYGCAFIRTHFPTIRVSQPQGTYMLFLDCKEWCEKQKKTMDQLLKAGWDVGVGWQDGRAFFDPYGIRMNLALPMEKVKEAFDRLEKYVFCN